MLLALHTETLVPLVGVPGVIYNTMTWVPMGHPSYAASGFNGQGQMLPRVLLQGQVGE